MITKPLALTMGEPAGIAAELTIKAWLMRHGRNLPAFVALTDPDFLRAEAKRLDHPVRVEVIDSLEQVDDLFEKALPVLPVHLKDQVEPGLLNVFHSPSVLESIELATRLSLEGQISGVVTNPIHKGILYEAGFEYPGHTEFLAHLCGGQNDPVMMLTAQGLCVVPITIHVPLSKVSSSLSTQTIIRKTKTTILSLQTYFGVTIPRIAVAGLNPHAGEGGAIGVEELEIIAPAISALREEGYIVDGPYPADTLFHEEAREGYDAVICMYHDQALIPIKTIDFYGGVNVTLGLPIIRTSPDHGTALNIAGKGVARPDSLISAISLAGIMARQV